MVTATMDNRTDYNDGGKIGDNKSLWQRYKYGITKSKQRPLYIAGTAITALSLSIAVSLMTSNHAIFNSDNADVQVVALNNDVRQEIDGTQMVYLQEQARQRQNEDAQDGQNALVLSNQTVTTQRASYSTVDNNRVNAFGEPIQQITATVGQLEEDKNYIRKADSNGLYYQHIVDGSIVIPSDKDNINHKRLLDSTLANQAGKANTPAVASTNQNNANNTATYNQSYDNPNGDYSNIGNNGDGYNNGGQGDGTGGGGYDPRRQTDNEINQLWESSANSYTSYDESLTALNNNIEQQRQMQQQQAQALANNNQQIANQAVLGGVQQTAQIAKGIGYTPRVLHSNNDKATNNGLSYSNSGYPVFNAPNGNNPPMNNGSDSHSVYTENEAKPPSSLPKHIIRAGEQMLVMVSNSVNTDNGLLVIGKVVSGKLDGYEVYGMVQPQGRNIGVLFTHAKPPKPRMPILPINAFALTVGDMSSNVATDIHRHYLQNFGAVALSSAVKGYGEAYQGANVSVQTNAKNGNVTVTKKPPTADVVRGEILANVGNQLNQEIVRLGNRPPTFFIHQGTVLSMVFANNTDTFATTDNISPLYQGTRPSTINKE